MNKLVATFFGPGYSPKAPGTVGALGACLIFAFLQWLGIGQWWFVVLLLLLFAVGVYASSKVEHEWGEDDNRVVVDEAFGMGVALLFIPFRVEYYLLAFVLFRLFDIWKPLGIRNLERLKGGWGVMADDLLAGIYANVVVQVIVYVRIVK